MKCGILAAAAVLLSGCVSYRISPSGKPLRVEPGEQLRIAKANDRAEGFQCFEPMLWFVTLGIVPQYCTDTYKVEVLADTGTAAEAEYLVTGIVGWAALFAAPLPAWQLGDVKKPEREIEKFIWKNR